MKKAKQQQNIYMTQSDIARKVRKNVSNISRITKKHNIPKIDGKIDYKKYGHLFLKPKQQYTHQVILSDDASEKSYQELQRAILIQQEKKIKWEAEKKKLEVEVDKENLIPKENVFIFIDKVASEVEKIFLKSLPKKIIKITEEENEKEIKINRAEAEAKNHLKIFLKKLSDEFVGQ